MSGTRTDPGDLNQDNRVQNGSSLTPDERAAFDQITAGFDAPSTAAPLTPSESATLDQIGAGIQASNSRSKPRPSAVPSASRTSRLAGHRPVGAGRDHAGNTEAPATPPTEVAPSPRLQPESSLIPEDTQDQGLTPEGGTPNDSSDTRPTTSGWQNDDTTDKPLHHPAPSEEEGSENDANPGSKPGNEPGTKSDAKDQHGQAKDSANNHEKKEDDDRGAFKKGYERTRKAFELKEMLGFAYENRKTIFSGGGAAGVLGILALIVMSMLPLKLDAIIQNFYSHENNRIESYVERRVEKILYRAIYEKITGENSAYANSDIFKMIVGNVMKKKFEIELFEKKGIKIERVEPHSIRFVLADGSKFDADSWPKLANWLEKDQIRGRQADLAIRDFVRSQYKPIRFLKRRHMRKYLRNAYRIYRWDIRKQEDSGQADGSKQTATQQDIQDNEFKPTDDLEINSIGCIDSEECKAGPERSADPDGAPHLSPPSVAADPDVETGADATKEVMKAERDKLRKLPGKVIEKTLTSVFGETVAKLLLKGVPVVGWVALVGQIDNAVWHGKIQAIGVELHSAQYAAVGATWASLAAQFRAGQLAAGQINVIMMMLTDIERSNAFQRIFFGYDGGQKIPESKYVGSDSNYVDNSTDFQPCDITYEAYSRQHPLPPAGWDKFVYFYRAALAINHPTVCFVYKAFDKILSLLRPITDVINGAIMNTLDFLTNGYFSKLMNIAGDLLKWLVDQYWTPVYNGEWGAPLGNVIDGGFDVMANTFCRDVLGGMMISLFTAQEQSIQVAADNQAMLRQHGPFASLLDTQYPQSIGSRMLALLPATPTDAANKFSGFATAAISHPFSFFTNFAKFFSPSATAASWVSGAHVQQFGFTEEQLSDNNLHFATEDIAGRPTSAGTVAGASTQVLGATAAPDGRIDQYDCPVITDPRISNPCETDTVAAQVLCSSTSDYDDGGLGGHGDPGPCGDPVAAATSTPSTGNNGSGDGGTPGAPCTTVQQCAQLLLASKATYWTNNGVNTRDVVQTLSTGGQAYTTCANANGAHPAVNIKLMQFLVEAAQSSQVHHIMVNALTDKCHSDGSNHYKGLAVDLDINPGNTGPASTVLSIASKYGGVRNSETSHYHIDFLR